MLHILGIVRRVVPLTFLSRIIFASPNKGRESPACPVLRLLSRAYSFHSGTRNRFRIGIRIYHVSVRYASSPKSELLLLLHLSFSPRHLAHAIYFSRPLFVTVNTTVLPELSRKSQHKLSKICQTPMEDREMSPFLLMPLVLRAPNRVHFDRHAAMY